MSSCATLPPATKNHLLASLPRIDRQRLFAECEVVSLAESQVLFDSGDCIRHVYFPTDSSISLITLAEHQAAFEVGLVGNEGMLGISMALGIDVAPQRALVQGQGRALRIRKLVFKHELAHCEALHRVLDRYLYVLMCQLAQTGVCTRFHLLQARLARWLLMSHDRVQGDTFHLTHEFLAYMLGMRRVGITSAAGALQKMNLISYRRGVITIIDRKGLEAAACACYQIDRDAYANMLGS